jgi:hypothetical protein
MMRARRQFRPTSILELEGRVVLSQGVSLAAAAAAGVHAGDLRPVKLAAAEIAQSNASNKPFGVETSDTLQSGTPVAEQLTIKYSDGSVQTESLLEVPNIANNSVTTYETINLRNNGGVETVVGDETFSGGTLPFSGNDRTHNITITLPSGSTETETENVVITGRKTVISGTINEAGGGVETWTTDKVRNGHTTTAHKMIVEPNGTVEQQLIVTTSRGELDSTSSTTTVIQSKNEVIYSSSATNVIRVQPSSTAS